MPIEFRCHQCNKLLRVGDETAGKQAKCPACGAVQVIPHASPAPEIPSQPPTSPFGPPLAPVANDNPYAAPLSSGAPAFGEAYEHAYGGRRDGPPWEREGASFSSFVETVKQAYGGTGLLFGEMRREGGLGAPLFFGLIGGTLGNLMPLLVQAGIQSLVAVGAQNAGGQAARLGVSLAFMIVFGLIATPIGAIISMFLFSGVYHVMLLMLGGARQPFETTFRVVAYSLGSSSLLGVIPFCGPAIGGILNLVFVGIGLSRTHEISGVKAALAVLLPMIVCCGAALAFYGAIVALVVARAN